MTKKESDEDLMNVSEHLPFDEHHEESVSDSGEKVTHRGVYLLPNLFTSGALFGGFFAILAAIKGDFSTAALAIFAAQVLDGFDGRVARMTRTESVFGTEYDSLSDMVSFGLAPAIVVYIWGLQSLGKYGVAAAFIFCVCAAIRLARFNAQASETDSRYFVGLASPPAATLVASGVWWGSMHPLTMEISIVTAILVSIVGVLMISNLRYHSFKGLDKNRRVPFVAMLITLLVFVLIIINPPIVLFTLALIYTLSGPLSWLKQIMLSRKTAIAPKND